MKKICWLVLMFVAASLAVAAPPPKDKDKDFHEERIILKGKIPPGYKLIKGLGKDRWLVEKPQDKDVGQAVEHAKKQAGVVYAEPDYEVTIDMVPTDGLYVSQWEHPVMHTPEAWDVTTGSPDILLAIIDTGVDAANPDLAPKWVEGHDFWANIPGGYDTHFHGSHVAGTAAGIGGNGYAIAGICWGCSVTSYKFLSGCGSGSTSDGILAIDTAVAAGSRVLNNSWGGGRFSQALLDSINAACEAGVVFVASAGNNGRDTDLSPAYPAGYDAPCIISVGASDATDARSSFSNWGRTTVDLLAPGSIIVSLPGPPAGSESQKPHSYVGKSLSGTSMAAPMVTGAAGLLLSLHPSWTWVEVKEAIMSTVDVIPAAAETVSGGRLNVAAAVAYSPLPASCGDGICTVVDAEFCPNDP